MMSLDNEITLPSFLIFTELEKSGMSRDELGAHLVKNIPIYKNMLTKAAPKAPPSVVAKPGEDLVKRRIHALLSNTKAAALPRSAVPWLHMVKKTKTPRGVIPSAAKETKMPNRVATPPETEPSPLSASSIKSIGSMSPTGKLTRVKMK